MSGSSEESPNRFQKGATRAVLGVLIALCGLVSLTLVLGAPGQVTIVSSRTTSPSPPQIEVSVSLRSDGWVDVLADPVMEATFILGNGSTISQEFYFEALTVPAGEVTRSSWNFPVPSGSVAAVNLTAYIRMRGPMSEASRAYRVP